MAGVAAQARQDRVQLGIVMMLVAYLLFAFIDTSAKWLVIGGLHAFQLSFMRYAGHFAISLFDVGRGGISRDRFATDQLGLVVLRAALLVSSTVFNFIAIKYLPLTITSSIMFSAPIVVSALSMPILGERVGPWRWFAICLGFIGVLVVIRPFDENFHWAALLSVYNAFALALYSILTRRLSGVIATKTMQLYMGGLGTIVLFPLAIFTWKNPENWLDWTILISLGIWGWAGHELLTRAHGFGAAHTMMPYTYSFVIYLTISSYLVFNHVPDQWTMIGAAIIVLSGLFIWARENKVADADA